jgi:hypothetical protein
MVMAFSVLPRFSLRCTSTRALTEQQRLRLDGAKRATLGRTLQLLLRSPNPELVFLPRLLGYLPDGLTASTDDCPDHF